ncbi:MULTISPECIES: helix-turn-helix domain-containing protein [unclassified Streptomyces]|uniref:helix-turn-helix domain-containing protein n=1 Tax=Streptomyces TaxID=1883 RepID=UPI001903646C|nr:MULTISPECIES: pyridoxamine 5'-phosphate oxidase family protein [unclassified Streptomyces]MCU4749714.1 pyridoxamine 5'-phosphate oxidase family protein [Streptomyces sp. G-5]QQN76027.1 pyridoxamine 5'-phosphate oxidase family protein [Streptomyces sp. XC 2026]
MAAGSGVSGDLGRRAAVRRAELGLSRAEVAERAGFAEEYLAHVEESPDVLPGTASLLRLAGALRTSVAELLGGTAELPPGLGQAGHHPELVELSEQECRDRLSGHGVGRVALYTEHGPAVVPVNYTAVDGSVVYRTAHGSTPGQAVGQEVAFEVDRIDEAMSEGWSVLLVGHAIQAGATAEGSRDLEEEAGSAPWAGGEREVWVRIEPERITGRRIQVR